MRFTLVITKTEKSEKTKIEKAKIDETNKKNEIGCFWRFEKEASRIWNEDLAEIEKLKSAVKKENMKQRSQMLKKMHSEINTLKSNKFHRN